MPALVAVVWLLAACTESTTFYGAPADELHGRSLLVLQPTLIAPTPIPLHEEVVQRAERGLAELPGIGTFTTRAEWRNRPGVPLGAAGAYDLYSGTLSVAGMSDPQLSRRLGEMLHADLLVMVQPVYIACTVCEEGSQLWLVGQVMDSHSGRTVFRMHIHASASEDDPQAMTALADAMVQDFLHDVALAFQLRPHRQRFENLRHLASR